MFHSLKYLASVFIPGFGSLFQYSVGQISVTVAKPEIINFQRKGIILAYILEILADD